MELVLIDVAGTWRQVADAARTTMNKDLGAGDPPDWWKKSITRAEHSPIRLITFHMKAFGVKSWITVHNVRHSVGIDHFVSTQRSDRTGVNRDEAPQGTLVNYEFNVNLMELVHISRLRFCGQAHSETQGFWNEVINFLDQTEKSRVLIHPVLDLMAPKCVACGGRCPEMKPCGFSESKACKEDVEAFWAK